MKIWSTWSLYCLGGVYKMRSSESIVVKTQTSKQQLRMFYNYESWCTVSGICSGVQNGTTGHACISSQHPQWKLWSSMASCTAAFFIFGCFVVILRLLPPKLSFDHSDLVKPFPSLSLVHTHHSYLSTNDSFFLDCHYAWTPSHNTRVGLPDAIGDL